MSVIGTCSLCGGPVETPDVWNDVHPPVPRCRSCGATKKEPHGPVVEMEKRPVDGHGAWFWAEPGEYVRFVATPMKIGDPAGIMGNT